MSKAKNVSGGRKGFAAVFLAVIFFIASIFAAIYGFGIGFAWSDGVHKNVVMQKDIYLSDNSLKGAVNYLESSLRLSTYQAVYDFFVKENSTYNMTADPSEFAEKIKGKISSSMASYTRFPYSFLSGQYQVELPAYVIDASASGPTLKITATPAKALLVEKSNNGQSVRLERRAYLDFSLDLLADKLYPVYDNGIIMAKVTNSNLILANQAALS